jgi:hypothetical protein
MDRTLKSIAWVLIAALIVGGAFISFFAYVQSSYERSLSSTYVYQITLETDEELTNATLFIPLPDGSGTQSPIVLLIGSGNLSGLPEGWTTEIYGTEKFTMLKITAETIAPQVRPLPIPISETGTPPPAGEVGSVPAPIRIIVQADAGGLIDTRDPVGNSSVLLPKYNLTPVPCSFPYPDENPPACYTYEGLLYAEYSAPPGAAVTITVGLTGTNEWFVFGWTGNEFRDQIVFTHSGESHGWQTVSGTLVTGVGRYEIL